MLAGVALLQKGGALDPTEADATVELQLKPGTSIDAARQEISLRGAPAWKARQVGEVSDRDDRSTVTLALPGSNLAAAIAWLRNPANTGAESETVRYAVDPEQLELTPLSTAEGAEAPAPVLLDVRIAAADESGGGLMILGWLLLIAAAVAAAVVGLRWYRADRLGS